MQPQPPAVAARPGILLRRHPRQRRMAPFAGDAVVALEQRARRPRCRRRRRCRESRRRPARAARRAVHGFGQREAVRIVGEAHFPAEPLSRSGLRRRAVVGRVVGVDDHARCPASTCPACRRRRCSARRPPVPLAGSAWRARRAPRRSRARGVATRRRSRSPPSPSRTATRSWCRRRRRPAHVRVLPAAAPARPCSQARAAAGFVEAPARRARALADLHRVAAERG